MNNLLNYIGIFINMIMEIIVQPNNDASKTTLSLFNWLFSNPYFEYDYVRAVLLLSFGIFILGGSIGILKRFLWKN